MKYRKKPVVVEALQWKFCDVTLQDVLDHFELDKRNSPIYYSPDFIGCLIIGTHEDGYTIVNDGDYIVRGVSGKFYRCKPDIFELTHELVEEQEDE